MLPVIEQLLVVQDRDRRIHRLQNELAEIPLKRKRIQDKAAATAAAFENAKLRGRQIESDKKKLELEAASKMEFIRKCETLQGQTKSNEEYKRYTHQIETTHGEIHAIEDQEIVLMEQAEAAAKEFEAASKLAATQKSETDKMMADLAVRETNLKKDLESAVEEREDLTAIIDELTLTKYERLMEKKGDNVIVGVKDSTCGGCHMKLPQQSFIEAKAAKEIAYCPNCGRMLYHTRDMDPEPGAQHDRDKW